MRASAVLQSNWTALIKPSKLDVQPGHDAKRFAKVVAEPLERGFGLTLGNALRRVLLSSLQGAAVTSLQIDGVLHEFSSIAGVREDVTDIVLNIKTLALKMHGEGPKRIRLRAEGPGEVLAKLIETGPLVTRELVKSADIWASGVARDLANNVGAALEEKVGERPKLSNDNQ